MKLLFVSLFISFGSLPLDLLASEKIPVLVRSLDSNKESDLLEVDQEDFKNFLKDSFEQSQDSIHYRENREYVLDWIVLGLSADLRLGIWNWYISPSMSMEFHLKRISQ